MNSLFQDANRQLTKVLYEKTIKILRRFTILLYYDHKDAPLKSSNAQNLAHAPYCRLANPALQLAPAVIVIRPDDRNGNKRVCCI